MTTSSPRTTGAASDAAAAATIHPRRFSTKAFTIRKKHSAEYGYARVSSTIQDE